MRVAPTRAQDTVIQIHACDFRDDFHHDPVIVRPNPHLHSVHARIEADEVIGAMHLVQADPLESTSGVRSRTDATLNVVGHSKDVARVAMPREMLSYPLIGLCALRKSSSPDAPMEGI